MFRFFPILPELFTGGELCRLNSFPAERGWFGDRKRTEVENIPAATVIPVSGVPTKDAVYAAVRGERAPVAGAKNNVGRPLDFI